MMLNMDEKQCVIDGCEYLIEYKTFKSFTDGLETPFVYREINKVWSYADDHEIELDFDSLREDFKCELLSKIKE